MRPAGRFGVRCASAAFPVAAAILSSFRQETPYFFPGWRLMNLGLDAFVLATIQNSS
jgi:hypothetical protein